MLGCCCPCPRSKAPPAQQGFSPFACQKAKRLVWCQAAACHHERSAALQPATRAVAAATLAADQHCGLAGGATRLSAAELMLLFQSRSLGLWAGLRSAGADRCCRWLALPAVLLLVHQPKAAAAAAPLGAWPPVCSTCLLHPLLSLHAEQAASGHSVVGFSHVMYRLFAVVAAARRDRCQQGTKARQEMIYLVIEREHMRTAVLGAARLEVLVSKVKLCFRQSAA